MKPYKFYLPFYSFLAIGMMILPFSACNNTSQNSNDTTSVDSTEISSADVLREEEITTKEAKSPVKKSGKTQKVDIYDQGFQMVSGTYTLPADWKLDRDMATDPYTAQYKRYKLDFTGPNGEFIRGLAPSTYFAMMGQSFEQSWRQKVGEATAGMLQNISSGQMRPSETLENSPSFKQIASQSPIQGLEVPFDAIKDGSPIKGMVYICHLPIDNNYGLFFTTIVISPNKIFDKTLEVNEYIANNYKPNPKFQQRMQMVQQNVQQRMTAEHQQRMANNQASFQAHQQRMKSMSQANDARNQQWMDNHLNTGWGTSSSESNYTSHEAFLDAMRETSTFEDPYSGQQVQKEGNYKYNYTNGLGDFYGTDDPNFNPSSMQGNWQKTEPLQVGDH